jgi:glycosyltransferase involved in cell wall biosynthesis
VNRGAEVAFESIAREMGAMPGFEVTLIGSGHGRHDTSYRFIHAGCVPRERFERWPMMPVLRNEYAYEELTFIPRLWGAYRPSDYDVTITCSYPFTNWLLRWRKVGGRRPLQVFVTQNGDWPLQRRNAEFRWFDCDAVVCINPDYYDAHAGTWPSRLIPNGVNCDLFHPGPAEHDWFGLSSGLPIVLIVSALVPSKRVVEGVRAVASLGDVQLVVAGDGPQRDEVDRTGRHLLNSRFRRVCLSCGQMPALYRTADVFLHMSLDEPFGNVYIEALASGLPVVAHDRRVTRWALDRFGTYVDAESTSATADGVCEALKRQGPTFTSEAADYARHRFSWHTIAQDYARFIQELVGIESSVSKGRGPVDMA